MKVTELHPLIRAMLAEPTSEEDMEYKDWLTRAQADYIRAKAAWEAIYIFIEEQDVEE